MVDVKALMLVEHFKNSDPARLQQRLKEQDQLAPEGLPYVYAVLAATCCLAAPMGARCAGQDTQLVPSCQATHGTTAEPCLDTAENLPAGKARIYVFRPDLSELQKSDTPTLVMDDRLEMTLGRLSCASFDLEPGEHRFALIPDSDDSQIWNIAGNLKLELPGRYYLAIWNSDIAYPESRAGKAGRAIKQTATSVAIGIATAVATGGMAVYPIATQRARTAALKSEARFELIDQQQALDFIRQCAFSAPRPRQTPELPP